MKYNQAGRRTILLYGEPGTSKTSTLYQLAIDHKATKSVVFTSDIRALMHHVAMCEKYSVPTIACFEDCESVFQQNNSEVKGFLSGIHAKQNKFGTCMIFTTNYPDRIEQSILERPERIDELHYIGSINGKMLIDCAKYYFGTFAPSEEQLVRVLTKPMAGAEVKLFVDNTLRYCAANQKDIDEDSMRTVLGNYRKDIKDLQKFIKGRAGKNLAQTYDDSSDGEGMGFHHKSVEVDWTAKRSNDE
jgi:SpoVK/Ycf46/Vps4 family AAA+-type ATPase